MRIITHSEPTPESKMNISEDLLHYIWKLKNFNHKELRTTSDQDLKIISFGHHNHSDGPDFINAKIEIDGVIWSGSIEIHIQSSDWYHHSHHNDSNYDSTILHVVYHNDKEVTRTNETKIPCLELKSRIDQSILSLYQKFDSSQWIPCESLIHKSSDISRLLSKERAITQRLERRWDDVNQFSDEVENDWEEAAYRLICRSFGLVHNAEAFLEIAKLIPYSILKKNSDDLDALEAIFMGTAGLLDKPLNDSYSKHLWQQYSFFRKKYSLSKINIGLKHKAVRPNNFPEIALSQFVSLMRKPHIFSLLLNADLVQTDELLKVSASSYWDTHYTFNKISRKQKKSLGLSKRRTIIVNAIVPLLYFMSKKTDDDSHSKKAISFLEKLPPEKNRIIQNWSSLGLQSQSSYDTQSLLELKKNYCDHKKCLSCSIGHSTMNEKT